MAELLHNRLTPGQPVQTNPWHVTRRLHGTEDSDVVGELNHHLKTYPLSFEGTTLVDWLIEQVNLSLR